MGSSPESSHPLPLTIPEEATLQNELTLRQIVDGISALLAVMTPDGAVEDVNRQVLDYFGKTLEELKKWASTDAVHPDDPTELISAVQALARRRHVPTDSK